MGYECLPSLVQISPTRVLQGHPQVVLTSARRPPTRLARTTLSKKRLCQRSDSGDDCLFGDDGNDEVFGGAGPRGGYSW